MLKFEYMTDDDYTSQSGKDHILMEWEREEEDIWDILDRFKCFLLAKTYSPELVERIRFLEYDELAKIELMKENE